MISLKNRKQIFKICLFLIGWEVLSFPSVHAGLPMITAQPSRLPPISQHAPSQQGSKPVTSLSDKKKLEPRITPPAPYSQLNSISKKEISSPRSGPTVDRLLASKVTPSSQTPKQNGKGLRRQRQEDLERRARQRLIDLVKKVYSHVFPEDPNLEALALNDLKELFKQIDLKDEQEKDIRKEMKDIEECLTEIDEGNLAGMRHLNSFYFARSHLGWEADRRKNANQQEAFLLAFAWAEKAYEKAHENHDFRNEAVSNLASLYKVKRDYQKAISLYYEAAEKENKKRCLLFAFMLELYQTLDCSQEAEDFLNDPQTQEKILHLDLDNRSFASTYIANLYLDGGGSIKKDPVKAYHYFKQAYKHSPNSREVRRYLEVYWDMDGPFNKVGYLKHNPDF